MKVYSYFALNIIILMVPLLGVSQGIGINSDGSTPDASSILDIKSTTKGVLLPRMTDAERDAIASPSTGLQIINTESECLEIYFDEWLEIYCKPKWNLDFPDVPETGSCAETVTRTVGKSGDVFFDLGLGAVSLIQIDKNGVTMLTLDFTTKTGTITLSVGDQVQIRGCGDGRTWLVTMTEDDVAGALIHVVTIATGN